MASSNLSICCSQVKPFEYTNRDSYGIGTITLDDLQAPQTPSLAVYFETLRTNPVALRHLRAGITERKVVRFDYIHAKNERTTREMEPVRLHFNYSNWYVYGFCRTRRDYREFRLARMMNCTLTPEIFHNHHEVPKEETALLNQDQVIEVVLRVGRMHKRKPWFIFTKHRS